jgi:hypothetical protein
MLLATAFVFNGCSQDAPVGPISGKTPTGIDPSSEISAAKRSAGTMVISDGGSVSVQYLQLPPCAGAKPVVKVSKRITAAKDDNLSANFNYLTTDGKTVSVDATISIPRGALTRDTTITMELDTACAMVNFGPHGLAFLQPVTLDYSVTNPVPVPTGTALTLYYIDDFSAPQPASSGKYYVTNNRVAASQISVLAHFSRYAFGH